MQVGGKAEVQIARRADLLGIVIWFEVGSPELKGQQCLLGVGALGGDHSFGFPVPRGFPSDTYAHVPSHRIDMCRCSHGLAHTEVGTHVPHTQCRFSLANLPGGDTAFHTHEATVTSSLGDLGSFPASFLCPSFFFPFLGSGREDLDQIL